MEILFYIYVIISSLFCLAATGFVVKDVIAEHIAAKNATPPPEPEPEPVIEEDEIVPEELLVVAEPEPDGVPIVEIMWQEHKKKGKTYKYSTNGLDVENGDTVLVPTFDAHKNGEIARKATVCTDKYYVDPAALQFKLKPILRIVEKHS